MAETYLPLLDLIGELAIHGAHPKLTLGLTPILLEQLTDPESQSGFAVYLDEQLAKARGDRAQFLRQGQNDLAALAGQWEVWYLARREHFEKIDRDIAGQFRLRRNEGHVQLLGGAATHAYLPLLLNDQSIRAQ